MKRTTLIIVAALVAALAACALAGCGSQSASSSAAVSGSASASAASESASASAAAEPSQEELVAELKDALANAPAYKSVTIDAEESTITEVEDEGTTATTLYKFDASGEKLKTSAEIEIGGVKLAYYTDGDDAVCVTDGPVYSGTVEQFELSYAAGADVYLKDAIGDLGTLVDCAAQVEKMESNGITAYLMTLDPEKYIESDEALKLLAQYGSPVKEAFFTISFDEDGSIGSLDLAVAYEDSKKMTNLMLKDYDSTTVDPMPEATRTFEDMEQDMQLKYDALFAQLEAAEAAEAEAK